jgi:hypothetical protein
MFDLDVIVPVCGKFLQRIEDFKRYGLVNRRDRSVRVNLIVSGEKIEGLDSGWDSGFDIRVFENASKEYVANIYGHYLSIDTSSVDFRWLIRLDDDSSTDVDGLVSNLDLFYDHEKAFHLGDINDFRDALSGQEGEIFNEYKSLMGDHEGIAPFLKNEIECGVMSKGAVERILSPGCASRLLVEKRASLAGGYGDCVMALASAMSKVYPIACPFITHRPLIHEFSLLGGVRNHIHQVSRSKERENLWECSSAENFALLTKVVDNDPTDFERSLFGKRLLIESEDFIKIIELMEGYKARVKFEEGRSHWLEHAGEVLIMKFDEVVYRIKIDESGSLSCEGAMLTII